ncbi:hypothetical protein BJ165DRAFT_1616021 [Panaeolus papilionaceus]|nr:hypothetical protein BJ165DRAFT_1616021 [Panaeolus papilionaceus]
MNISKDQLDGVTKDVQAYRLEGIFAKGGFRIHLLDVPGFGNAQMSELRVVDMIRMWIDKSAPFKNISHALYFESMIETRSTGYKARLSALLEKLVGPQNSRGVTIATTMWDQLKTDVEQQRAETRFHQLKEKHWKSLYDQGANLLQFHNTQVSAYNILRDTVADSRRISIFPGFIGTEPMKNIDAGVHLYHNLIQRLKVQHQLLRINVDEGRGLTMDEDAFGLLLKEKVNFEQGLGIIQLEQQYEEDQSQRAVRPMQAANDLAGLS